MEPSLIFSAAFLVGLSGAMAPGPVTVLLTRLTLKKGFICAPLIALGHGLLELIMLLLLVFGLGNLLTGRLAGFIGILGGGVLLWMGQKMIRNPLQGPEEDGEKEARNLSPVHAGIMATVFNPYWFLWWGTVGAGFVSLSMEHGFLGVFSFFSGHLLSDLLWLSFLAFVLLTGKRWITDGIYQGIFRFLGSLLLLLGVYFIWSGFQLLL